MRPFTYGLPRDAANLPTMFAMQTRITGGMFGPAALTQQVRAGSGGLAGGGGGGGSTASEATDWLSDTALVLKMARKAAGTHLFSLTAGARVSSVSEAVSYDRAMLVAVVAFEEAATGSKSVTVLGNGLGAVNVTGYTQGVRIGFTACEATDWISSTTVYCRSPSGISATRRVRVTAGQQTATITESYSFERPMLSDLLPGNAAATGRMTVTCLGSNFGLVDFTIAFRVGGTACEASRWVADSSVKCKLAAGVSSNRWVEVSAGGRKSAPLFSLFTYADAGGSYQVWNNMQLGPVLDNGLEQSWPSAFVRRCDEYRAGIGASSGACGWTGAVHGLVLNEPGTTRSAACAGTDGKWPQTPGTARSCSVADCALGSCTANSQMRSDYPMTRAFSYDSPTILHHSVIPPSGNSAFGSTAGGWILTIVGRNFGFYADVVNVSVGSALYDNPILSQATGRYWHGKAVCRIPCTPGSASDGVGQSWGDEYQCDDRDKFVAGGGNRWMSDSHILCVMPAGVGVARGLTVAVGSAQVDGPSPVPSLRGTTQYGQNNGFGRAVTSDPHAAAPLAVYVDSAATLFGWGYCAREAPAGAAVSERVFDGLAGSAEELRRRQSVTGFGRVCRQKEDCLPPAPPPQFDEQGNIIPVERDQDLDAEGRAWVCLAYGTLVRNVPAPAVQPGLEVALGVSRLELARDESFNGDLVSVEPWSVPTAGEVGIELSRPPGINVGPSDLQLDQMTHSPNAFSYARPVLTLVVPREGAVRRERVITVDGANFGVQSRYVEVVVGGIPARKHSLGQTLVSTPDFGAPYGGQEEVCCSCEWYCQGEPRRCACRASSHGSQRRCVAGSTSVTGDCREYRINTCGVTRVHQQLTCTVPDLHHDLDEGMLPIYGAVPDQKSPGDRDFKLCTSAINGYNGPCPLSKVPGYYVGWSLKITYPANNEYDIRHITAYDGLAGSETRDYRVSLSEALRAKAECDEQFGCPTFRLTPKLSGGRNMDAVPSNLYNRPGHPFPGFCGQHQVRVRVDGQASRARQHSRENANQQSLIYLDDKPHVIQTQMSADGMYIYISFDVQTTHGRGYRSRPGLRSDVFKYDCNGKPAVDLEAEQDCNNLLMAAAVADTTVHGDGEKIALPLTSGIEDITVEDGGWGCVCPMSETPSVKTAQVDCGEVSIVDPRGMGAGFKAVLRARKCQDTEQTKDCQQRAFDEEFGTGMAIGVKILEAGSGYYGGLGEVKVEVNPASGCKEVVLRPVLQSSRVQLTSTERGAAVPLVGLHIKIGYEKLLVEGDETVNNRLWLVVQRGQKGSTPVDHAAGMVLQLELDGLLGAGSRCRWLDTANDTFAPFPFGRSTLQVTFGFGARIKPCVDRVSETGRFVCNPVRGIPGGDYHTQVGIEPLIWASLFLRPGVIVQRHKLSYPADGCHPAAEEFGGVPCKPVDSNDDCVAPQTPRCALVLKPPGTANLPVVRLVGPTAIGVCDGITIDAIVSWGAGSRKVTRYEWSMSKVGAAGARLDARLQTQLNKMNEDAADCLLNVLNECGEDSGRARLHIPASDDQGNVVLSPGAYKFGVTVTTFLGLSQYEEIIVTKNASHSIPSIKILAPDPLPVFRAQGLQINSEIDLPAACLQHLFQQLTGISGQEDIIIQWSLVGGDSYNTPHDLEDEPGNSFVTGVNSAAGSTIQLSPKVMEAATLGQNYTLQLSVQLFDLSGSQIINDKTFITIHVLPSAAVISIVNGGLPVIHRSSGLGKKCGTATEGFAQASGSFAECTGEEVPIEPVVIDASSSFDPDGGGLCFRWDCVEPVTCPPSDIGRIISQDQGSEAVGFVEHTVRFQEGIKDEDICQLYQHEQGALGAEKRLFGQNKNSGATDITDKPECARLLEDYGIMETRLRLKLTVVKQLTIDGSPSCTGSFPADFGESWSEYVDLTVVAEPQNRTRTRLEQGWTQPLVRISPIDKFVDPQTPIVLSCMDPFIDPTPWMPTPPQLSYVWTILEQESHVVPLRGGIRLGSDPCALELPPNSLHHSTMYRVQLTAFLPDGTSSRAGVYLRTSPEPIGGVVRVFPTSGVSVMTEFTLSAYYWTAESQADLPLKFSFGVITSLEGGQDEFSLGPLSQNFQVTRQKMPRSIEQFVTAKATIYTSGGGVYKEAFTKIPVEQPNRTDTLGAFLGNAEEELNNLAMMQNWGALLDLGVAASSELANQVAFEWEIYEIWGNRSDANFTRLYAGLPNEEWMEAVGGRRLAGDGAGPPVFRSVAAEARHVSQDDVGDWTQTSRGSVGMPRRRLLAAPSSLVAGLQLQFLRLLVNTLKDKISSLTAGMLTNLAKSLRLLTTDKTESEAELMYDVIDVIGNIGRRAALGGPYSLRMQAFDDCVQTLSNVHVMMHYHRGEWDHASRPLSKRIIRLEHGLTQVMTSAVTQGPDAKPINGAPALFSKEALHTAAWRVSADIISKPLELRAFWQGVSVEIFVEATGVKRPNRTKTLSEEEEAAAEEGDGLRRDGVHDGLEELQHTRRLLQEQAGTESNDGSEASVAVERDWTRQGDSRVVMNLYAQPPRTEGLFPYWTPAMDDKLRSSVYAMRITEGAWSSLAADEFVTITLAFDASTAQAEVLTSVTNETNVAWRCFQYMPIFNSTGEKPELEPRMWEDRACITRYPPLDSPPNTLTCVCTLPDIRQQNDFVEGFPEEMPW